MRDPEPSSVECDQAKPKEECVGCDDQSDRYCCERVFPLVLLLFVHGTSTVA